MLGLLRARKVDATKGSIIRSLIIYTVPIIISTLIQGLFNTVDMIVLAKMSDSVAYASVGATTSIVYLLVNTFIGLSTGVKVMISRYYGAKDEKNAEKTVSTALLSSFFIGVVVAVVGFVLAPSFLRWTNCPEECFEGALIYIRLYVAASPAILVYNFGAAILRSVGDSQRPLYYIIVCGLLNISLNVILCFILSQKVAAVAIATVASQILGAVLVLAALSKNDGIGRFELKKMTWDTSSFFKILRFGLPSAVTTALFPIANLQIQAAINSYGVAAMSGNTAAIALENFPGAFTAGLNAAATAFVGQNLGAEKHDRVKKTIIHCLWLGTLVTAFVGFFIYFTGDFWLAIVQPDDPAAYGYARVRMACILLFYSFTAVANVLSGAIQSYGYATLNTATTLFSVLGFRVIWMFFVYPRFETFEVLMACFSVSWVLRMVLYVAVFFYVYSRYKKGKYVKI